MSLSSTNDPVVESLSPPTRRRPSWIAAGVLLVALSGLLGSYLYSVSTSTISVVVAAHDLTPGEIIERGDLRVVEMGRTGDLSAITSDKQDLVLGSTPRALIPSGTIINTGLFIDPSEVIPEGKVLLGAWFDSGESAVPNLPIGADIVLLDAGSTGEIEPAVIGDATVWGTYRDDGAATASDSVWVAFLVDRSIENQVASVTEERRLRIGQVRG